MGSTTLMTFLVRTPPSTRTVSLLGSWDNFNTPYVMRRDSRIGPEHWSGCHSFSNIICDGHVQPNTGPRQGGLKMGGTYWYYYKLDDEIEFHNSAEPSTTHCPLLPGQLVNVLHVPFTLGGNRSRNTSISSNNSDIHTLNPADKFLNPRPVPQPRLPRLKTSPSMLQTSWSSYTSPMSPSSATPTSLSTTRGGSQPNSATTARLLNLKRSPSLEQTSRSVSPNLNRGRGFRRALRTLASPRSDSPEVLLEQKSASVMPHLPLPENKGLLNRGHNATSTDAQIRSLSSSRERSPFGIVSTKNTSAASTDLALRKEPGQQITTSDLLLYHSFQGHRRQRTSSREPSPLRNPTLLDAHKPLDTEPDESRTFNTLDSVKEIASAQNTPRDPLPVVHTPRKLSGRSLRDEPDLEKRLPTLPNTPSSAYPPSATPSPAKGTADDTDGLQSHFSCTTIETGSIRNSFDDNDIDDRSTWLSGFDETSPVHDYTASFIEDEPMSPQHREGLMGLRLLTKDNPIDEEESDGVTTPHAEDYDRSGEIASINTNASMSTAASPLEQLKPTTFWSIPKREDSLRAPAVWNKFQHYRLPSDDSSTEFASKDSGFGVDHRGMTAVKVESDPQLSKEPPTPLNPSIPHSTGMRQLLNELSYLGNMIRQN